MAEGAIRHNEIIEIDKTLAGIKKIIKELERLQKTITATAKSMITFQKGQNINTPGGRQATKQAATDIEKLVQKNKKLTVSIRDLNKEQVRLTEERRKTRIALKQEIAIETSAIGSLNRMRAEYNKLTTQYNNANAALRKKLTPQMQKLDRTIRKNEEAVGRHQRSVGRYQKAFANAKQAIASFALGVVGATAVVMGMIRGIKAGVSTILNFDQAMADVAAITRASTEEITALRKSAKDLGGVTKFTASEVAGLQKELGKLGFTTKQILSGTSGILALAAATGEDLARSAEVAGSVIRAFGLDTSEAGRVADVMARSFTGSALTLEKFAVAMRSVAPVAKAFGFTIEETTALLGSLANAGFDASMAGTATRNILLNLADTSGALAKKLGGAVNNFDELIPALIQLRESGVSLNETLELTDKRSVAAFSRFLEGAEFTRKFREELVLAAGAAEEMAEIQLNTLKGDLIILKSAMEALTIEVGDAKDGMKDTARGGVQVLTSALIKLKEQTAEGRTETEKLINTYLRLNLFGMNAALIELFKLLGQETDTLTEETVELVAATSQLGEMEQRILEVNAQRIAQEAIIAAQLENKVALLTFQAEAWNTLQESMNQTVIVQDEVNRRDKTSTEIIDEKGKKFQVSNFLIDEAIALGDQLAGDQEDADNADIVRADAIFNSEKKLTDAAIKADEEKLKSSKKAATGEQKISLGQSIVALAQGVANTVKAGFPINIPLLIGYFAQTFGILSTIKSVKFAEGGHGELGGERHSQGGTHIPGVGEAERGEYFGIINRSMTQKYSQDLPAIFDSLNSGKFHDVWSNANIQLQESVDPWTKKMYDLMVKTPVYHEDSNGDTVKELPDGYIRVIRKRVS